MFGYSPAKLLTGVAAGWFDQWRAAYDSEPWGEERSDRAMAQLIAYTIVCHGMKPDEDPNEYMPYLRRPKPPAEPMPEEMVLETFAALAKALGGELVQF